MNKRKNPSAVKDAHAAVGNGAPLGHQGPNDPTYARFKKILHSQPAEEQKKAVRVMRGALR